MDSQIRNFKDFLQLYNKMTEMCFAHCVDNFFTRDLSATESNCLDKCVLKFSNVNQRVMASYVRDQAIINERRMKEMEEQVRAKEAALAASAAAAEAATTAAAAAAETASAPMAPSATIDTLKDSAHFSNSVEIDSNNSSKAPILKLAPAENSSQNLVT